MTGSPAHRRKRKGTSRKGAAIVEFAVVAPVLVLLLLGMIDCGRMIMVQHSLTNASREGARAAAIKGSNSATAVQAVEASLSSAGIKGAKVTVSPNNVASLGHGDPVTVSVSVKFRQVSWLPAPFLFANKTLASSATMGRESPN